MTPLPRLLPLTLAVLAVAATSFAEEIRVETARKLLEFTDREHLPPVGPVSKSIDMGAPSDGIGELPGGALPVASGAVEVAGKEHAVVLANTPDNSGMPDRLAIDRDGDGKIAESEIQPLEFVEMKDQQGNVRGHRALVENVVLGSGDQAVAVNLYLSPRGDGWYASASAIGYREGSFEAGGKSWILAISDGDWDGSFGGSADGWTVVTGKIERPASTMTLSGIGHGRFVDGQRFRLVRLEGDTAILDVTPAEAPDPADDAAQRERVEHEWAARFDQEREQFEAARGMDTNRPRAVEPIHWRWVTFDEAQKLAKEEGKPLFVDVLAFWCVWCYRMDYYTYVDAEVAKVLNEKFVPVKIVQEQDRVGDYARLMKELELRGIPAMGIWSPEGKLVHKISGWKKPEDFLTELKLGLETSD